MNNIDILEELIRDYKDEKEFVGEEIIKAMETLIAENKELKEEIEKLKINKKFLEKQEIEYIRDRAEDEINFRWKDKIKAKIEEVQQRRENDGECELPLHGFQREAKIEVLQSLLEKGE